MSGVLVMGVVNATPDSFSDGGRYATLDAQLRRVEELLAAGADLIDIGGQSAVTGVPELSPEEESERVVPLVERVARELGATISVDTYKPAVAEACLAAGATIVNDVSGLLYEELAGVCARAGARLVVMHNRSRPKERLTDPALYDDVVADVVAFLGEKMEVAQRHGVAREALIADPGPDFAKTPAQTVTVLRALDEVRALGAPVLLALSRKDFVGALTRRPPRERLAGTLAAIAACDPQPGDILRVHDVAEVRDFLAVWDAVRGAADVPAELELPVELRREAPAG